MTETARLKVSLRLPLDSFVLDLEFECPHQVTGIFGVSGSGKTSLVESISGLRRGAMGRVQLGKTVWQDSSRRCFLRPEKRHIGYVPQEGLLFPHKNVRQNLLFATRERSRHRSASMRQDFDEVIELLEISHLLKQSVVTLSGGELQRVALGRALCSNPQLLIMDEPLSSLDLALRQKILPFLARIRHRFDLPILLVSHHPIEIKMLCDDVLMINQGRLIRQCPPAELLADHNLVPASPDHGYKNLFSATVIQHSEDNTVVELFEKGAGPRLTIDRCKLPVGQRMQISIPARSVLIAAEKINGVATPNQLSASIKAIDRYGAKQQLTLRLERNCTFIAELPISSAALLDAEVGKQVVCLFNPNAIHILN